jgi:hypothetical protein
MPDYLLSTSRYRGYKHSLAMGRPGGVGESLLYRRKFGYEFPKQLCRREEKIAF